MQRVYKAMDIHMWVFMSLKKQRNQLINKCIKQVQQPIDALWKIEQKH